MASSTQFRWKSCRYHISGHPSNLDEVAIHSISCEPPDSIPTKGTVLLIHGFPGTSYQFRHVITPLADAGYYVVCPDYRGAGHSSHPRNGYDKITMASDLHTLLTKHMGIKDKVHLVGYDIGGKIAAAYAFTFPEHVASIFWGEGPLPGSEVYDKAIIDSAYGPIWHFIFHWQTDIPEMLVDSPDKVRIYLRSFFDRLARVSTAITAEDIEFYTRAYSQPGAMRSACDIYRAFHQDVKDNRSWMKANGKSDIPCFAIDGGDSMLLGIAEAQGKEFFSNVESGLIEGSGHYLAEEQPEAFVEVLTGWLNKNL